jgi:hypothetical protein
LGPLLTPLWFSLEKALDKAVSTFQGPHSTFDIARKLLVEVVCTFVVSQFFGPKGAKYIEFSVIVVFQN